MKMCQALARNGVEVTLLAPNRYREFEDIEKDIFTHYSVENSFSFKYLTWLSFLKGRSYLYEIFCVIYIIFSKPNLVFTRRIFAAFLSSLARRNTILELHAPIEGVFNTLLFRSLIQMRHLRRIVVITRYLRDNIVKNYSGASKLILVAPDGADSLAGKKIKIKKFGGDRVSIGYCGHLYQGKGIELIEKLAEIATDHDFHIVGGSKVDISYWKKRCSNIGNIFFHGYVSPDEVKAYLHAFDLVLLPNQPVVRCTTNPGSVPSKSDIGRWTSPLKLFEYMALGKVIVASDLPVLREILVNNGNAILCSHDNAEEWKIEIDRILLDKDRFYRLGSQALVDFEENYSWEQRAAVCIKPFCDSL